MRDEKGWWKMQKIQLICFPYAGGSASFFRGLGEKLQNKIEVTAVEYAGHGTRRKESYYHTFEELVQDMTTTVRKVRNPEIPYAIFGYSMGSVVAYGRHFRNRNGNFRFTCLWHPIDHHIFHCREI